MSSVREERDRLSDQYLPSRYINVSRADAPAIDDGSSLWNARPPFSPTLPFAFPSSFVHHGARLDFEELQETAHRLLTESDYTQQQMADRLDVSRISVARATTEPGPKFQRLQMRIIEALSDYEVERRERVEFLTWASDPEGS